MSTIDSSFDTFVLGITSVLSTHQLLHPERGEDPIVIRHFNLISMRVIDGHPIFNMFRILLKYFTFHFVYTSLIVIIDIRYFR